MDEYELPPQKGMEYFHHTTMETEVRDASISIRRWWWEYLRLSRDYWMVCQTSRFGEPQTQDKKLAEIYKDFGNVYDLSFEEWWVKTGSSLFAERQLPPRVQQITSKESSIAGNRAGKILVEIPLQLTRETVQSQLNDILDQFSDVRPRNRLAHSTSKYPIEPVLSRLNVIQEAHEVHCLYRELIYKPQALARLGLNNEPSNHDAEANLFRIGKACGLSPSNANLVGEVSDQVRKANNMRREVKRVHERAINLIGHVERGRFPLLNVTPTALRTARFTPEQIAAHTELEQKWWSLDLYSSLSENRIAQARGIFYETNRRI